MKKCVLIYEDDLDIMQLCKIILTASNYQVETRNTCENIVADVKEVNPDIILMDLWIPEIGGEQAILLVKKEEAFRDIPIVIFSANEELDAICKRIDASGYLKKPFDIMDLKNIIQLHVKEGKYSEQHQQPI